MGYTTKNYTEQGAERTVIGGSLDIVSGGEIDIEAGGALKIVGVDITAELAALDGLDAELALLNGITASAAELNLLDDAESVVQCHTEQVAIADINTGHVLVSVPAGKTFNLIDCKLVAIGGDAGGATSVDIADEEANVLVSAAVGALTENSLVTMSSLTVLPAGASFLARAAGSDISITKSGAGALDTCTHVLVVLTYMLKSA